MIGITWDTMNNSMNTTNRITWDTLNNTMNTKNLTGLILRTDDNHM